MQARTEDITSSSPEQASGDEYWRSLAQAKTATQLCQAWLAIMCNMIPQLRAGMLLFRDNDGSYAPVATWPDILDPSTLGEIARQALHKRQGMVERKPNGRAQFAYPLQVDDQLHGAVVFDFLAPDDATVTRVKRLTHWGSGWLVDLFNRRSLTDYQQRLDQSGFLFDVALAALSEDSFMKSALAVVNRLAQRFNCHHVQLGTVKGKTVQVVAASNSAWFDEKTKLVNLAALAMNEAYDQGTRIVLPEENDTSFVISAHRRYAEESGSRALCSQPLTNANNIFGICLLERDTPFTEDELNSIDILASTLVQILELKMKSEENLFKHSVRSSRSFLRAITDTSRPGLKLIGIIVAIVITFAAFYTSDYRVGSQAVVEGSVQRVAVAPFQSYIREALVRAGDVVHKGQVLARLEDKDLQLERTRWAAELEINNRKQREAMANADRVALVMATAQADQAQAYLNLAEEKLKRVEVVAPFDGVVVRGDLSQKLGSPVNEGDVLFELAPLDAWRVILKVDERDIANVKEGEPGELRLTSMPGQSFSFSVKKVVPISVAEDGRNYFRVEASLGDSAPKLQPGMEGVAKVEAGERSLLWIATHRLTDWLHMLLWKWGP